MSYIGQSPIVGNFQICDAISVVNGQAAYTMQVGSANVSPETANHMIVSLNGVIQKPNSSYTISGSTITFASNLASGDVIDFIQLLGDVLDIGTPSDGAVTSTKLASNSVTTAKINNDAITVDKLNLISTGSVPSLEAKGTSGVTEGYIQLNCAENTHGIKIKSPPHSASASYTLTMPNNDGDANQFLQTNGSGVLTWAGATANAGTLSFQSDRSGGFSVNASTSTEVVFNATAINTGSKYSTSTGRYTPGVAGNYFVTTSVSFDPASSQSTGQNTYLKIRKNGVDTEYGQISRSGAGTESNFGLSTSAIITLDDNDYISIWVYSYQVAMTLASDQSSFNGFRIS